jgi:uncharacterized protein (DUF1697 family)
VSRNLGRYVALLRGINVGGKNKLPMKDLARVFEGAGCSNVKTYIQSGNVVFSAPASVAKGLPTRVAKAIEKKFRFSVPIVVRSASELEKILAKNPYARQKRSEEAFHVMFLANKPPKAALAGLDRKRSPPDEYDVVGSEIFLYCPNGIGRSKLTNAYFDSKLETVSTARNWRTCQTLLQLANEP